MFPAQITKIARRDPVLYQIARRENLIIFKEEFICLTDLLSGQEK